MVKRICIAGIFIVAAGIIFIPMLFQKPLSPPKVVSLSATLPPAPDKPVLKQGVSIKQAEMAVSGLANRSTFKAYTVKTVDLSAKKIPASTKSPITLATIKPIANAWVVQVGSFDTPIRAVELAEKIKHAGFPGFIQKVVKNKKPITRVYVGPEIKRAKAQLLANELNTAIKLKGILVPYNPLEVNA